MASRPRRRRAAAVAALGVLLALGTGSARGDSDSLDPEEEADAGAWVPRAILELGVDSFGQIFRITDDLQGGLLDAESSYRDTTDVFTEVRGLAEFALEREGERLRSVVTARLSTGTELDREGLELELDWTPDEENRVDAEVEIEARQFRDDGDFSLDSDAQEGRLRARWRRRLGGGWESGLHLRAEAERFDTRSLYELDSDRADLSALLSWHEGWSSWVDLDAGVGRRAVRDSTEISYSRAFLFAQAGTSLGSRWQLDLRHVLERRVYDEESARRPFWDVVVEPSVRLRVADDWRLGLQAPLEWLLPDENTPVYFDLFTGRGALDLTWIHDTLELGGQLRWSWLSSSEDVEDRYEQPSVELHLDWLGGERFWLSLSEEFGERRYRDDPASQLDLYSDYLFFRTTLLGGLRLNDALSFELFFSDEPESHRRESDDSRLTLVSASLRARF